jgi:hypothetical protein
MKMTMKIGVLLGATFLASVGGAAAAECPLPEHGVVQLEWSVVRAGVHEALVEVIGPREAEPGARRRLRAQHGSHAALRARCALVGRGRRALERRG